jgi:hypothetical protein
LDALTSVTHRLSHLPQRRPIQNLRLLFRRVGAILQWASKL